MITNGIWTLTSKEESYTVGYKSLTTGQSLSCGEVEAIDGDTYRWMLDNASGGHEAVILDGRLVALLMPLESETGRDCNGLPLYLNSRLPVIETVQGPVSINIITSNISVA